MAVQYNAGQCIKFIYATMEQRKSVRRVLASHNLDWLLCLYFNHLRISNCYTGFLTADIIALVSETGCPAKMISLEVLLIIEVQYTELET